MPSIRRSLLVYFLLLLAVGLGGMALLADQVTGTALSDKAAAEGVRIDQETKKREEEERDKFDRELLAHAREIARTYSVGASEASADAGEVFNRRLGVTFQSLVLGAAPVGLGPARPFTTLTAAVAFQPPAFAQRGRWTTGGPLWNWVYQSLSQLREAEQRPEAFLPHRVEDDGPAAPLVQVNHARGVWRSSRVPAHGLPFDLDEWNRRRGVSYGDDWEFDTVPVSTGPVRRVVYKRATSRNWPGPPRPGPQPGGPPPSPPPPGNFYHVALPTTALDAAVKAIHADADRQRGEVGRSTADSLRSVRLLLGGGSLIAFAGLLFGGWVLVSVGLLPLRKLTAAVSQVSQKDFHLPVEASELSHELLPIHHRLAQALNELKEAFEREKQAVADISHELRTPVAGLLATIDVTLRKPRTAEQYKQALDDCRQITKQLSGLVERVMTLAYLDAGQTATARADTDAAELARGCAAVIRPLAESHGLTLTTDVRPTPPLNTDPDKLREVMINLLHNAVEYNQPGGSVNLAVRREENGGTVVEVTDTGIGMTPDVRGKIFERFYRADPSRTATGVHAGLGLAIVKEYVDRLGGSINVESEPGRGSTFRVTLPG